MTFPAKLQEVQYETKSYEVDSLVCPQWVTPMEIVRVIEDPQVIAAVTKEPIGESREFRLHSHSRCDIMSDMKQANVRQVQRNFSELLGWIEQGQEVLITRRNRIIAKLVPSGDPDSKVEWPDFEKRLHKLWGKQAKGKPASTIIVESREERF
jgi:antitoxin (DNA-binding transcriptional repressor) of toxin-antitoxin stability system